MKLDYQELLQKLLKTEGKLNQAYRAFHDYSLCNQIIARDQLESLGLDILPIATYKQWQAKGRQVSKGSKAIELFVPKMISRVVEKEDGTKEKKSFCVGFVALKKWFTLGQTEGDNLPEEIKIPEYDLEKALIELDIKEVQYSSINGNAQGYAFDRSLAINPLANMKHKTRFHEMGHIILGHTTEWQMDNDQTEKNIKEVEAELVAFICCSSLGLDGAEYSKDYIDGWLMGEAIPDDSIKKAFKASEQILKAGV